MVVLTIRLQLVLSPAPMNCRHDRQVVKHPGPNIPIETLPCAVPGCVHGVPGEVLVVALWRRISFGRTKLAGEASFSRKYIFAGDASQLRGLPAQQIRERVTYYWESRQTGRPAAAL